MTEAHNRDLRHPERGVPGKSAHVVVDLRAQLARRRQHQAAGVARTSIRSPTRHPGGYCHGRPLCSNFYRISTFGMHASSLFHKQSCSLSCSKIAFSRVIDKASCSIHVIIKFAVRAAGVPVKGSVCAPIASPGSIWQKTGIKKAPVLPDLSTRIHASENFPIIS